MRLGIVGYGRLGRAAEQMAARISDFDVTGVFTRREAKDIIGATAPVYPVDRLPDMASEIDCALICLGSSRDTPSFTPRIATLVNTVDSYDKHIDISRHRSRVDGGARLGGNCSLVSVGWDPGLFSLFRIYMSAFLPDGITNTFWGRGISQGHSEAIRKIRGVKAAVQYTVPKAGAVSLAESGARLSDTERHERVCYVVCDGGEEERIKSEICGLDGYFRGYSTRVNFITEEELAREHGGAGHGGRVVSVGRSGVYGENCARAELSLTLDSNPEFTAGVMLSASLATVRMKKEGRLGAYTLFDIPPSYLLPIGKSEYDYF